MFQFIYIIYEVLLGKVWKLRKQGTFPNPALCICVARPGNNPLKGEYVSTPGIKNTIEICFKN